MSFMGTVGSVAQAGQTAVAPTNVSIATSSSGNYDDAVVVDCFTGITFFEDDGSSFSSRAYADFFQVNHMASAYNNNAVTETFIFKGYCRATGATSFLWDVSIDSNSDTNGTYSVIGTASTSQDATGTDGAGEKVYWQFAGGKSGVTYPPNGTVLIMKVNCTATNAYGSTAAPELTIMLNFD